MERGKWFQRPSQRNGAAKNVTPEALWMKCPKCREIHFAKDVERNLRICPHCGYHYRLKAVERLEMLVDPESFIEIDASVHSCNPLEFPGYAEKLHRAQQETGLIDSVLCGYAKIERHPIVVSIADFEFLGGSMGSVVGEKLARAMERSLNENLPFILLTANGGGARMFEGLLSLMQMAKTSAAISRLRSAGVPYIVVLTDPTMAGVYASYASLGDVILAEPGALIGFAGRRVGNQDMGMKLPDDFQTSEFQFRSGQIDQIVTRKEMRSTLGSILTFFAGEEAEVAALA